ncbi:hypothetical protein [Actinomadura fibrosa]|uniref:Polysaccharide chain length determinant N-terminal domain-containing protein n=1 Tax=Actinomadura fibrosa TaxID=111802 RepID=A0ABW2XGL9_9ACTN
MTAQTPVTPEISLVEAVWRYRLMSFLIVLACALASIAATQILFSGATATARFAVTDPTNNNNVLRMGVVSGQGYATYTAQRAAFAGSTPVMARAAEIVRDKRGPKLTGEQLRGRVQTSSKPDGGVVIVTAKGASMAEAAVIANAVLQAYQEVTVSTNVSKLDAQIKNIQALEKKVTGELEVAQAGSRSYRLLSTQLTKLQAEESGLLSSRSKTNDGVQFLDNADPSAPTASKLPQNLLIGIAIGIIVACVVSFLRASARPRNRPATTGPVPAGGPGLGGAPGGAYAEVIGGAGVGPVAELPAGRPYQGRRHAADVRAADDRLLDDGRAEEPPAGRGRRARGHSVPPTVPPSVPSHADPAAERAGRLWSAEEVHGPGAPAAQSPSATQALPATPPAPPPAPSSAPSGAAPSVPPVSGERRSRLNGSGSAAPASPAAGSGTRGTRVAGNGSSSLGKSARGKGSRAKPRGEKPAEPEKGAASDLPVDLWAEGGDPTRTAEDPQFLTGGKGSSAAKPSAAAKPASGTSSSAKPPSDRPSAGKPEEGSGSGKGKGDSSLMHYDIDR